MGKTTPKYVDIIKELILEGKSNEEIWAVIQPKFNMPDNLKYYPSWYRSYFRRKQLLPPEIAEIDQRAQRRVIIIHE